MRDCVSPFAFLQTNDSFPSLSLYIIDPYWFIDTDRRELWIIRCHTLSLFNLFMIDKSAPLTIPDWLTVAPRALFWGEVRGCLWPWSVINVCHEHGRKRGGMPAKHFPSLNIIGFLFLSLEVLLICSYDMHKRKNIGSLTWINKEA